MTIRSTLWRVAGAAALAAAVLVPLTAPTPAHAWWRAGGWGGWAPGFYVAPAPVYVAPVYIPPPAPVYVAPSPVWVGPVWVGGGYVPGHWVYP